MLIAFHVSSAILSLLLSGLAVFYPSANKLKLSYGLVAATLASGFYLVFSSQTHILQVCISGLAYLAVAATILLVAQKRLANQRSEAD